VGWSSERIMALLTARMLEKICKDVFNELGPYHTENVYGNALEFELIRNNILYRREVQMPIKYKDVIVGQARVDFFIKPSQIVELKAIATDLFDVEGGRNKQKTPTKYRNQVRKYLQSMGIEKGYLVNFNIGSSAEVQIDEVCNPPLNAETPIQWDGGVEY